MFGFYAVIFLSVIFQTQSGYRYDISTIPESLKALAQTKAEVTALYVSRNDTM